MRHLLTKHLPGSLKRKKDQGRLFANLIERTDAIARENNINGLLDLQRLIIRPVQSKHMADAYLKNNHCAISEINPYTDFGLYGIPSLQKSFFDFLRAQKIHNEKLPTASLGRDIVLPTCWNDTRIISNIGQYGSRKNSKPWKQDANHQLTWWFPLNVFWVVGGNHSITQGIVLCEGAVKAEDGADLSKLYEYVKFNGFNWIDTQLNKVIGKPRYKEFGYLYEIGRRLVQCTPERLKAEERYFKEFNWLPSC